MKKFIISNVVNVRLVYPKTYIRFEVQLLDFFHRNLGSNNL